jgi:aspartyl aminopeptidase
MHSIRETCGSEDVARAIKLFEAFYEGYVEISGKIVVDDE